MTLLILGSTGTLGRQIVRQALNEGFQVKCFVRNFRKAAFLKEWGAELIYGDLKIPETIPTTLYGITAIIDAATTRAMDSDIAHIIDLESKRILIKAAKVAQVKKFIFFSIINARYYKKISLINFKIQIEDELKNSNLNYTIFLLSGFFQGLIQQYAIPILDKQPVWITQDSRPIPYIDTQDVAKLVIKSLSISATRNKTFNLSGQYAWTSSEVIELCEKLAGQKSKISTIPIIFLQVLHKITRLFQWSWSISERLAFISFLIDKKSIDSLDDDFYTIFQIKKEDFNSLPEYLEEYFTNILRRMRELNEQKQDMGYSNNF